MHVKIVSQLPCNFNLPKRKSQVVRVHPMVTVPGVSKYHLIIHCSPIWFRKKKFISDTS